MQDQERHPPPPKHSDRVLLHNTDTTVNNWFDPAIGFVNQTDNIQPLLFIYPWCSESFTYFNHSCLTCFIRLSSIFTNPMVFINSVGIGQIWRPHLTDAIFLLQLQDSLFLLSALTGVVTRMSRAPCSVFFTLPSCSSSQSPPSGKARQLIH